MIAAYGISEGSQKSESKQMNRQYSKQKLEPDEPNNSSRVKLTRSKLDSHKVPLKQRFKSNQRPSNSSVSRELPPIVSNFTSGYNEITQIGKLGD